MRKIGVILLSIFLLICPFSVWALEFNTHSQNIIFYNQNDGTILYEKNSEERISIASMTKIMTAIVVLESVDDLDEKVRMTNEDFDGLIEANAAQAGFYAFEEVTYRDLLNGLLLPSGAEAAQALTRLVAGGKEPFVEKMNEKAKELKLENTHFANPTGLDDPENYSSVKDVSIMFQYALKNENFKNIISERYYTTSNGRHKFRSTIQKMYDKFDFDLPYLIGGKTGTTDDAGLCFASIASQDGVDYLLVTAKAPYTNTSPDSFYDARDIYEYFMNHYSYQSILDKGDLLITLPTQYTKEDEVSFYSDIDKKMYLENEFEKSRLTIQYEGVDVLTSRNQKGEKLGEAIIYDGDKELMRVDIVLKKSLEFSLSKWIIGHKYMVIFVILCIIGGILFLIRRRKRV